MFWEVRDLEEERGRLARRDSARRKFFRNCRTILVLVLYLGVAVLFGWFLREVGHDKSQTDRTLWPLWTMLLLVGQWLLPIMMRWVINQICVLWRGQEFWNNSLADKVWDFIDGD